MCIAEEVQTLILFGLCQEGRRQMSKVCVKGSLSEVHQGDPVLDVEMKIKISNVERWAACTSVHMVAVDMDSQAVDEATCPTEISKHILSTDMKEVKKLWQHREQRRGRLKGNKENLVVFMICLQGQE